MKKIISLIAVLAMMVTMFSFTVNAELATTLTMKAAAEGTNVTPATESITKASVGEEFVVTVLLGTTAGLKDMGFHIVFDPNDIEIGTAADADALLTDPNYADYIGEGKYYSDVYAAAPAMIGRAAFIDKAYVDAQTSYGTKKIADAQIGYEVNAAGKGDIGVGYIRDKAIDTLPFLTLSNANVAAVVLRVKTAEAKQTTITLEEASANGSDGVLTPSTVTNSIVLNLNGYGEVVEEETPAEKINLLTANGVAKSDVYVTNNNGSKYHVDSALVFVSSVDKGNTPVKTVITCDDFADTKLEIEAAHTQEINGLTYFAAAMSSIKETNYGKTFKATAYVTNADGEEVVGVPATGIFTK